MRASAGKWLALGFAVSAAGSRADTVSLRLKDGSVVRGEILGRTDSSLTIRNGILGELTLRTRDTLSDTAGQGTVPPRPVAAAPLPKSGSETPATARSIGADPSDQALFFLPTAFLPPAKAFTFRDFELLFMTFGYSPGPRIAISAGFLFPISPAAQVVTAGLKHNLWSDGSSAALSITGNLTKPLADLSDDLGLFANTNLVASKRFAGPDGETAFGIHGAVGYLGHRERFSEYDASTGRDRDTFKWQGDFDYGLGAEAVLTPNAKFLVEYVSAAPFSPDNSFNGGLLTLGFRLHGERLAADIAGVRPFVGDSLGDLILWPLLVVSYRI